MNVGEAKAKLRLLDYHEDQDAHIALPTSLIQLATSLLAGATLDFITAQCHQTLPQSAKS